MGASFRRCTKGAALAAGLATAACATHRGADAGFDAGVCGSNQPGAPLDERCTPSGWCWENPTPQGNDLSSVFGATSTDVWAVGGSGTLLHWDGGNWSLVESGSLDPMNGVFVADGGAAWAIGDGVTPDGGLVAEIFAWDGLLWRLASGMIAGGLADTTLAAIYGTSPSDVWAVGTQNPGPGLGLSGVVLHWNGDLWGKDPGPATAGLQLEGVWSDPAGMDVWVAGASTLANYSGVLLHRTLQDAGSGAALVPNWETISLDCPGLHRIWGSAGYDLTAVGGDPATGTGTIVHWDGRQWSSLTGDGGITPPELFGISGSGFGEAWATGVEGPVYHRDGGDYSPVPIGAASSDHEDWLVGDLDGGKPPARSRLGPVGANVWSAGPTDAWIAGGDGALFHWDGTVWRMDSPQAATVHPLRAVFAFAPNDVWAAGDDGLLLHFDGSATASFQSGTEADLNALWGASPGNLWAVGNGGIVLHWLAASGCGWTKVASGTSADLRAVYGIAGTDVWAAGTTGTLLHWDGGVWSPAVSGTLVDLNAVSASPPVDGGAADVWAVGAGAQLHWDGSSWSLPTPQLEADLVALWASPEGVAWAVGSGLDSNGGALQVWHYGGTVGWIPSDGDHGLVARGIWGSGSQDLFVAGWGGAMIHFDGLVWAPIPVPTNQDAEAIAGSGNSDLWLAGAGGMLLHQRR